MSITRNRLSFEGHHTMVPNDWARDRRMSRRAKGILVELMSHREGWKTTIRQLEDLGPEGRDAIRSALAELEQFGYLRRTPGRGDRGRFEVDWVLSEPHEVIAAEKETPGQDGSGKPVAVADQPVDNYPSDGDGFSDRNGFTDAANPSLKKTNFKKDIQSSVPTLVGGAVDKTTDDDRNRNVHQFPSPADVARRQGPDLALVLNAAQVLCPGFDLILADVDELAHEVLAKQARTGKPLGDATTYVLGALRIDWDVWQPWLMRRENARLANGAAF